MEPLNNGRIGTDTFREIVSVRRQIHVYSLYMYNVCVGLYTGKCLLFRVSFSRGFAI